MTGERAGHARGGGAAAERDRVSLAGAHLRDGRGDGALRGLEARVAQRDRELVAALEEAGSAVRAQQQPLVAHVGEVAARGRR